MITEEHFQKITHDTNGNPRYCIHYVNLLPSGYINTWTPKGISAGYTQALTIAKKHGGKRYTSKSYGGGIVFTTYTLDSLINSLNAEVNHATQD